jgi:general secretion pathway protein L
MRGRLSSAISLAARFLRWWGGELAGLIPVALRDRLRQQDRLPLVDVDEEGAIVAVVRPGRIADISDATVLPPGARCRLRLPASVVAGKRLALPEAAAADLAAVLRFQIEQETPFRAGDVYTDHVVVSRDTKAKRIVVDWHLAPRASVDRAVARAEALGLKVQSVGSADEAGWGARIDFLRAERSGTRQPARGRRLRPVLAAFMVLLFISALALPLVRKLEAVAGLDSRLAEVEPAAVAARRLADELEQRRTTAAFVVEQRRARPTASALLRELTLLLPDDTWLHRLTLKGDEVAIAGASPSSTALVALVDGHPWFREVTYRAPTLQRRDSGLEEFDLVLRLTADAGSP